MASELQLYGIDKPSVIISPEAHEAKRVALSIAGACTEVTDINSQAAASQAQSALKNLIKQVEASHAEIKAPVLTGLPFGHVPTKVLLPVGAKVDLVTEGRDALMVWGHI